jgi:two-component system KDP operon response regulator KdpE
VSKVLVVDDEPPIARTVAANLRVRGHEAIMVGSGEAALTAVETLDPDCVVLDLGLPGLSGLEVLRRLRSWTAVPVVVLTAMDAERDKLAAFELGADDYVTKPFGMASCWPGSGSPCATANRPRAASRGRPWSRPATCASTWTPSW